MIIEIIDNKTLEVKSYGTVLTDSYEIKSDIYSIKYTTFKVLNAEISKGDLVNIKEIQYFGVVNNKEQTDINEVVQIQCAPFDELINIEMPAVSFTGNIAQKVKEHIEKLFGKDNEDIHQQIPKLQIIAEATEEASIQFNNDEPIKVHDLLIKAFEIAGVYHTFNLATNTFGKYCNIEMHLKSNNKKPITLKTDFSAIRGFAYSDNLSQNENKIEFYLSSENGTYATDPTATRYLLDDNSITHDATAEGRILPVKSKVKYYQSSELENNSSYFDDTAAQELKGDSYNHIIEMKMLIDNKIAVPFVDFDLYSKITFIDKNNVYNTILTGYTKTQDKSIVSLTFGKVRKGLIDKIRRGIK